MKRVSVKCVVLCVVLSIGSMANAATWNGGAGVDLPYWDVASNWDDGTAPTGGTIDIGPAINVPDGVEPWACVIDEETEENLGAPIDLSRFRVGSVDGPGILTMTGGSLITTYFRVAKEAGQVGIINLSGGTMSTKTSPGRDVQIGVDGIGTLNMTGGSVITYNSFQLGSSLSAASFGYLNMDGGSITATGDCSTNGNGHLRMAGGEISCGGQVQVAGFSCQYDLYGGTITAGSLSIAEGMNMDVSGGKVVLSSNADLDTYINDGRLTAWGGLGMINVVEVNEVIDGNDVVTYEVMGTADADIMAKAFKPSPASGAVTAAEEMTLTWIAGQGMKAQNVYFGQDPEALEMLPNDVADANEGIIPGVLSVEFSYDVNGLALGKTYYWRVDEVNESDVVTPGDVWSFTNTPLELAAVVSPLDGATEVNIIDLTLEWESGLGAVSADVYFGTDAENLELVADDHTETTYAVTQPWILGMTYYWRVDSFNGNDVYEGLTWSFIVTSPAGSTTFNDGDPGNSLWRSPDNWSAGLPGVGSTANLRNTAGAIPVVDANTTAYCQALELGWNDGDRADMDITGGSLTVAGRFTFGRFAGSIATLYMYDGVLNVGQLWGWHGDIYIKMMGGEMNVDTQLRLASNTTQEGATSTLKLVDGVVRAGSIGLNASVGHESIIDVNDGVLILDGDQVSAVNGYVDAGLIKAYGGTMGSISAAYDVDADVTTVRACEFDYQADFTGDCVVDEQDRDLLVAALGTTTPAISQWDFDMSTDPTGEGTWDLHTRDAANADYEMSGEGTLLVNGALLLDQQAGVKGTWDSDLHVVSKVQTDETAALDFWISVGTGTSVGSRAVVGFRQYLSAAGTQTLELWTGIPPHLTPYEPVMVEGFAADAMVDVQISYDYETDTFDWTATDGTLSLSGTDVPYTVFGGGSGGSFTIRGNSETTAEIDQFTYTIQGSDTYSPYDLNHDRVVDQLDLDILEAEMVAQ